MNILVIGNGFDVAHGLPTSYPDFLHFTNLFVEYQRKKSLKEHEQFKKVNKHIYIYYFSKLTHERLQEYNDLINGNVWFEHFNDVFNSRSSEGKIGWIDFEGEIYDVIEELDRIRKEFDTQNTDNDINAQISISTSYKIIKNTYPNRQLIIERVFELLSIIINRETIVPSWKSMVSLKRLEMIKEKLIKDLNKLTRCLELYLSDFMYYDNCKQNDLFTDTLHSDYIITFNYTDTYERLYMASLTDKFYCGERNKKEKIHYIHGKSKKDNTVDDCDLVLGIEEYLEGDDRQKDNEYIEFKKFYQRIYKGTGSTYTNWLKQCNAPDKTLNNDPEKTLNVIIYGHSIATTDGDIIKNLIEAAATTTIYYYGKDALHDIILNLVQIIGEEELIDRTSDDSEKGSIIFMPIT